MKNKEVRKVGGIVGQQIKEGKLLKLHDLLEGIGRKDDSSAYMK